MLKVEDIHTYYGDSYVLQGVSLEVKKGMVLAMLGRNGVGKTTLIRSIVGFTPARSGRARSSTPTTPRSPSRRPARPAERPAIPALRPPGWFEHAYIC